jgi:hypothetical protein
MKQMRQCTIGMAFSDADSDYHSFSKLKVDDGGESTAIFLRAG